MSPGEISQIENALGRIEEQVKTLQREVRESRSYLETLRQQVSALQVAHEALRGRVVTVATLLAVGLGGGTGLGWVLKGLIQ